MQLKQHMSSLISEELAEQQHNFLTSGPDLQEINEGNPKHSKWGFTSTSCIDYMYQILFFF